MIPEEITGYRGLYVELNNRIDIDTAIKRLKNMIKNSGLLLDIQDHQYYTKPSEIKRDIKNRAKARQRYQTKKAK